MHYMEEPVISGPGGSGTVFFSHCTLGCVYCQNFEISRNKSVGKKYTPKQLAEEYIKLQNMGANNINFVTPTHYMPSILESCDIARKSGLSIPFVYNTSGFENPEIIEKLKGKIEIFLTDFKYFSPYLSGLYSKSEDYFDYADSAIDKMVQITGKPVVENGIMKSGVIIRHLMLPGALQDTMQVLRHIKKRWDNNVLVSLMRQYTPVCKDLPNELLRTITEEEYSCAALVFGELNLCGFIQGPESVGSDKIPDWN